MYDSYQIQFISLISGCVGIIAFVCNIYALTQKSEYKLRGLSGTSAILWSIYFWITGSHTAAILAIIIGIRLLAAYKLLQKPKHIRFLTMLLFQIVTLAGTYITWQSQISLIVWLAASIATYGFFMETKSRLRHMLMFVDILWLLHDYLTLSIIHALATITQIEINRRMSKKLKDSINDNNT